MTGNRRRYSRKGAIGRHSRKEERQIMTTFIARHGHRTTHSSAAFQVRKHRFLRSLNSLGVIMADSAQAARALESANTQIDRRAVLDRFAADTTHDAGHSAV
jgi:hypothetical protein